MYKITIACFLLIVLAACKENAGNGATVVTTKATPVINYSVVKYLPHDTMAYTEGLLYKEGVLYESTGSPANLPATRSIAGPVDTTTGRINKKVEINREYFGEGIVFLNNKLFQLTYKKKRGYVYDAAGYKLIDSFGLSSEEGWGLTTDGTYLIMSDGTSNISYIDAATYKVIKNVRVTENHDPINKLNELEYVNGFLYANIYTTSNIVKIDTNTGEVVGRLDCSSIDREARAKYRGAMEMNGIAWDAATGTFYVTGKMWPVVYAISFPH